MNDLNWGRRWGRKSYPSGGEMGTGMKDYPSMRMSRHVYGMTSVEDQKAILWENQLEPYMTERFK